MNFAPVLDLSGDNEENGLRARTFGVNPEMVSLLAGAYLDGMQAGRVVDVGRHFPGLRGPKGESHRRLPGISNKSEGIFRADPGALLSLCVRRPGEQHSGA